MSSPISLYVLTTSQTPLPTRYPRPHKPVLLLPALIHRSLHAALDQKIPSASTSSSSIIIPHPDTLVKHDVPVRTEQPRSPDGEDDGDGEIDAEVTVKLHIVGKGDPKVRASWVAESLEFLGTHKGLRSVDTLLLGFSGVDYKGKKTVASEMFGCGAEGLESGSGSEIVDEETERGVREVWDLVSKSGLGVFNLGTLYLPLGLLKKLSEEDVAPKINAMDTPDCQSLPKEYSAFARERGIELWAGGGGEGADPLPVSDLHNLLHEFAQSLSQTDKLDRLSNEHPLARLIPLRPDGLKYDDRAQRGVSVRWVLGYTLYSRARNVVNDKGYIVAAELLG
ncbi:MAG: hypothetical protein TREMPRED_003062 [Tremellales sp. Tagirdzhanova-0007]|nr:MAG: hypothetical protein TREMPRED_003062 [Tremellales sp. Tagirdzhanova-0007]